MQRKNILSCLLILLCLLSPGFSCRADAVETKIMGFTDVTTQLADTTFGDRGSTDIFQGTQRSRIWLMMNASENVGGTMMFELDNIWGRDAPGMQGGQLGADGVNIGIKEAYIDWKIPDSTRQRRSTSEFMTSVLPGGAVNRRPGTSNWTVPS